VLIKNYSIVGLHWGLYARYEPVSLAECHAALTALADSGAIRPVVSERLSLAEMAGGVQRLADGLTTGRAVYDASAG